MWDISKNVGYNYGGLQTKVFHYFNPCSIITIDSSRIISGIFNDNNCVLFHLSVALDDQQSDIMLYYTDSCDRPKKKPADPFFSFYLPTQRSVMFGCLVLFLLKCRLQEEELLLRPVSVPVYFKQCQHPNPLS